MNTADEVKAHAQTHELTKLDFLDRNGSTAASVKQCKVVRLTFADGSIFRISALAMKTLAKFAFKVRAASVLQQQGRPT